MTEERRDAEEAWIQFINQPTGGFSLIGEYLELSNSDFKFCFISGYMLATHYITNINAKEPKNVC